MSRIICDSAQIKAGGKIALRRHGHGGCYSSFAPITRGVRQGQVHLDRSQLPPTPTQAANRPATRAEKPRAGQRHRLVNLCCFHRPHSTPQYPFSSRECRRQTIFCRPRTKSGPKMSLLCNFPARKGGVNIPARSFGPVLSHFRASPPDNWTVLDYQAANATIAADAANIAHCRQMCQSRRHQMPQDASEAPARYLDMVPSAQGHCT